MKFKWSQESLSMFKTFYFSFLLTCLPSPKSPLGETLHSTQSPLPLTGHHPNAALELLVITKVIAPKFFGHSKCGLMISSFCELTDNFLSQVVYKIKRIIKNLADVFAFGPGSCFKFTPLGTGGELCRISNIMSTFFLG